MREEFIMRESKINKSLRKSYNSLRLFLRANLIKTVYFNFKVLPFNDAIRFPIVLYGRIKLHQLRGKVIIDAPVKMNMIKIGYRWVDLWPLSYLPTQIYLVGLLRFHGKAIISGGVSLNVGISASIDIGSQCLIGGGTMVKSMNHISIGDKTRITGNCTVFDSNMHYVKNIATGDITWPHGIITIGKCCWVNYGAVISKGSVIPDFSIVARNSFLSKDYSKSGDFAFIAGSPANVKNTCSQRIFSRQKEIELRNRFLQNEERTVVNDGIGPFVEDDDSFFE